MISGCNNFNYFPENQLTKFKLWPPTSLFLSPEDFCDAFCVAGSAFGRPCEISASTHSPPTLFRPFSPPVPRFLCPPLSAVYPLLTFPLPPSLVPAPILNLESAVSSPSGSGRSPAAKRFWCIFRLKSAQLLSLA